jgi:hypothetical protein
MARATRFLAAAAVAALALAPASGSALALLDDALSLEGGRRADLRVALLAQPEGPSLDFELLGEAPKAAAVAEDPALRTRRKMLNLHQGLGLGLLGLQLASTVTGQLNYNDKFGVSNTGRYQATHQFLTYTNLATFAVVGGIALFAPRDKAAKGGYGRTTIHKVGMAVATAGMIGQGVLGIQTARREGYLDKQDYGRSHLALGYLTLAAMSVAVGVIVF